MPTGRAVLAPEVDDLQVPVAPRVFREHGLEVRLRAFDRRAVRESPAAGESMDVRVDREGGNPEAAAHHDRRGLVPDPGKRFEEVPVADHSPPPSMI